MFFYQSLCQGKFQSSTNPLNDDLPNKMINDKEVLMSNRVKKIGEVISHDTRNRVSSRYKTVTKAINREFRNSESETAYSLMWSLTEEEQQ